MWSFVLRVEGRFGKSEAHMPCQAKDLAMTASGKRLHASRGKKVTRALSSMLKPPEPFKSLEF